ncbi:MAG: hypothetical protein JNK78_20155 [Planctomycetes bacterium]|nr:hypothetical protein [Planctomycetota bacterium]
MKPAALPASCLALAVFFVSCDGSRGDGGGDEPAPAPARLLVTTSTNVIEPSGDAAPAGLEPQRLGGTRLAATYRLTTPADEPFSFDLVSWREGAAGAASIEVAHVRDGERTPATNDSLVEAGIQLQGPGLVAVEGGVVANGDGFARVTLQGRIKGDQVIAVDVDDAVTIVVVEVGPRSGINRPDSEEGTDVSVVDRRVIYSSDSPMFGLPTVAVSGNRTSVVCYDGGTEFGNVSRYELRLQHEAATNAVTGGGSIELSPDSGGWRDHEIAALFNVLAVVRSETGGVSVRLSFDRGATFAQDVQISAGAVQSRLVQCAMAADYSLALAFWRASASGESLEMCLVEGSPVAFDATGSPTWFAFGAPAVLRSMPANSTPLTTGIAWSDGGDLVVGYGATWFEPGGGWTWANQTEFRCAVRRTGESMEDTLVDQQRIIAMDPTVAVLGHGASMQVFYAYEVQGGVRLAVSSDGGRTFVQGAQWGQMGDHLPTVFARKIGGQTRVDVLFLAPRSEGCELHRARWLDWPTSTREDEELTTARFESVDPGSGIWAGGPGAGLRSTQIGWLGYDATLDGDQIVVAYDEVTQESIFWWPVFTGGGWVSTTSTFSVAPAPPLAPGMTEPVRPVSADDSHQLFLLRLN